MVQATTTQEFTQLLEIMEDAYWRLKNLLADPELSEDQEDKIDAITTNLDEFFA